MIGCSFRSLLVLSRIFVLGLPSIYSLNALAGPPEMVSNGFKESVRKEVNTFGHYIVAVQHGQKALKRPLTKLQLDVPETLFSYLCVSLRSVDELYAASAAFDISGTEPGRWEIPFQVETPPEKDMVYNYEAEELVVMANVAADCQSQRDSQYVLASWDANPSKPTGVINIYVNGDGNDVVLIAPRAADSAQYAVESCHKLHTTKRKRAYDTVCRLANAKLLDLSLAWIELRSYGRLIDEQSLTLYIAPKERPK